MKKNNHFILLIVLLGLIVYANSLFNGFVWDDQPQLLENPLIRSVRNIPQIFSGSSFYSAVSQKAYGYYYKPLMTIFFTLIYSVFGANPFFFHLIQIVFHIINSILVFFLLKRWFNKKTSFAVAAIFLVHPMNVEAVSYVSAVQHVLFFFFGVLALWIGIKKVHRGLQGILVFFFLLLSLLAKETGILFALLLLIYIFLFRKKELIRYALYVVGSLVVYLPLWFSVVGNIFIRAFTVFPIARIPLSGRLINIPMILFYYVKTFFFPSDLAIDQQWVVKSINLREFYLPLSIVVLFTVLIAVLGAIMYRSDKKRFKIYLFFVLWFFLGVALHAQIVPLDMTVADRWFYVSMVGLLGLLGLAVELLLKKRKRLQKIFVIVFWVIVFLLSVRTIVRNTNWKDNKTLFRHDVSISTQSFGLANNAGAIYLTEKKYDAALPYFKRSVQLAPYRPENWNNLGVYYQLVGDTKKAKESYRLAILNGGDNVPYENLAQLLLFYDTATASRSFITKSLQIYPKSPRLLFYLALLDYKEGSIAKAREAARKSYGLAPNIYNYEVYTLLQEGKPLQIEKYNKVFYDDQ